METQNYQNTKIEFREIVLKHIQKILEISSHELRDSTYSINHGNYTETRYQEDTRLSYVQAIENLAFVLLPHFDDDTLKIYEECDKIINGFNYEIVNIFKDDLEKLKKETNVDSIGNIFSMEMRVKHAKKLFIALNMLLKRNDYLKSAVYGEDKDEVVEVEGDSE